jgi:hypothetical protein
MVDVGTDILGEVGELTGVESVNTRTRMLGFVGVEDHVDTLLTRSGWSAHPNSMRLAYPSMRVIYECKLASYSPSHRRVVEALSVIWIVKRPRGYWCVHWYALRVTGWTSARLSWL